MAKTTKDNVIIPDLFNETVSGVFAQQNALMGSVLTAAGAAVVASDMPAGSGEVGNLINVPYFGVIGDFQDIGADGNPVVPQRIAQSQEQAQVQHSALAFEVSRWARSSAGRDIYEEGAAQIETSATRKMDSMLIAAATAPGGLVRDVFSAANPRTIDYDLVVEGRMQWGDEQGDIAAMLVHSKAHMDMQKMKDATGRPMIQHLDGAPFPTFYGLPVGISDRLPIGAGSAMGTVTPAGTSPPTVTLSGTPNGNHALRIQIITPGTLGTATFRFSTDNGNNWSATMTTAASVPLTDPANDSIVGVNGATGITAAFAAGTYSADNVYTASAALKLTSLLLKKGALAFWYNKNALKMQTDKDILSDTDIGAMHLYACAHRYKRLRGTTRSGVVRLLHN